MKLINAARFGDDTQLFDGYTGAVWANGQVSTFIDSNVDGSISQRRVLSIAPGLTIPARRVVSYASERWLLGDTTTDMYRGLPIRVSVAAKKVTESFALLTPGQACLSGAGTALYGQSIYLKDTVNSATDSEYDPMYHLYFAAPEPVVQGSFLRSGTKIYRARATHTILEGFNCAVADLLDTGALVSVEFADEGQYDPERDEHYTRPTVAPAILLDMYKVYEYRTQADPRNQSGDMSLYVAKSSFTPVAGQTLAIAGETWRIVTQLSAEDAWLLHIRRA